MIKNDFLRPIRIFLLVLGTFQLSCTGEKPPPLPPIADVSFSSRDDAWVITNDKKLFHLRTPSQVEEVMLFRGKAKLVHFLNRSMGWVLDSSGRFWNTTDGSNWRPKGILGNSTAILHASGMSFATERIGWLTTSFGLWQTTDAGDNWAEIPLESFDAQPVGFFPVNSEIGWLLLTNGKILRTTDMGRNWKLIDLQGDFTVRAFYSDGKVNNWAAGADGRGGLFHTNIRGDWEQMLDEQQRRDIGIQSISFPLPQYGWFAGFQVASLDPPRPASGVIMKTVDGGEHWARSSNTLPDSRFTDIRFFDERNGWLASTAAIYHTDDGGDHWGKVAGFQLLTAPDRVVNRVGVNGE